MATDYLISLVFLFLGVKYRNTFRSSLYTLLSVFRYFILSLELLVERDFSWMRAASCIPLLFVYYLVGCMAYQCNIKDIFKKDNGTAPLRKKVFQLTSMQVGLFIGTIISRFILLK